MLKFLIEKEFKQIWRDPFIKYLIVCLPLAVMLVFPWATTMEIKNATVSIVDNDRSMLSEQYILKLSATDYFRITDVSFTGREAIKSIEYGVADVIVEIPSGFENSIMTQGSAQVQFSANAVNATKGSVVTSYLHAITLDFSRDLNSIHGNVSSSVPAGRITGSGSIGGISVKPYYFFNPGMDYKIPMIPALMLLVITVICGFLPSMNITEEKETGTIEQINVTPVTRVTFILGKMIPYWIIGVVVFSISLLTAVFMYALPPDGNLLLLFGVVILYIVAVSGIGLLISNYSSTLQQAMFMIFFFIIIMLLISGMFTPIESMPVWARAIAWLNPLTYIVKAVLTIYLKGGGFTDILIYVMALVIFLSAVTFWSVKSYRKQE